MHLSLKSACITLGILADDNEWIQCFTEAIIFASGQGLRSIFVTALLHGDITDPAELWNTFAESICDDLKHYLSLHPEFILQPNLLNIHLDYGLHLVQTALAQYGKCLNDYHLPLPVGGWERTYGNSLIAEELDWNRESEGVLARARIQQLNTEQKIAFDTIINSIEQVQPKVFFLQGPAGTGKTHVYNTICNYLRAQGKIVLCCASSGIAALLLPGGRTSHSRFKIPLAITESSTCNISHKTQLGELLTKTDLIIWDEVPMQHKYCFEAVSRTLNDLCGTGPDSLFGNIPILLGSDFAQILPVVRRGNRSQTVAACIQKSFIWHHLTVLNLKQNMRVQQGQNTAQFTTWLSQLSYDPNWHGQIKLPLFIHTVANITDLCDFVYPPELLQVAHFQHTIFQNRAVLAPHNDTVSDFNSILLQKISGQLHSFYAEDTVDVNDREGGIDHLPVEYLQSLNPASIPPSHLQLRVGVPVILLRNLDPKQGLCNGTRMVVTRLGQRCIEVISLTGQFTGIYHLIYK